VQARVLANDEVRDGWRLIRLEISDDCAADTGQWFRRIDAPGTLPVYLRHAADGWTAVLLPPGDTASELLPGHRLTLDGPFGRPMPDTTAAPAVVCGIGPGVPAAMALAERLTPPPTLVLLDGSRGVPGRICPSRFLIAGLPEDAIAGIASLETIGVVARVADRDGRPGCFEGDTVSLLRHYAAGMDDRRRRQTPLLALSPWQPLAPWQNELQRLFASLVVSGYPG
jgi:hypothetical protein